VFSHAEVTISDASVAATDVVLTQLAPSADFDADDLADVSVIAEAIEGAVQLTISRDGPIGGTYRILYAVGTP
jgi:hypothetical protein